MGIASDIRAGVVGPGQRALDDVSQNENFSVYGCRSLLRVALESHGDVLFDLAELDAAKAAAEKRLQVIFQDAAPALGGAGAQGWRPRADQVLAKLANDIRGRSTRSSHSRLMILVKTECRHSSATFGLVPMDWQMTASFGVAEVNPEIFTLFEYPRHLNNLRHVENLNGHGDGAPQGLHGARGPRMLPVIVWMAFAKLLLLVSLSLLALPV